jgi:hypothetical protein
MANEEPRSVLGEMQVVDDGPFLQIKRVLGSLKAGVLRAVCCVTTSIA